MYTNENNVAQIASGIKSIGLKIIGKISIKSLNLKKKEAYIRITYKFINKTIHDMIFIAFKYCFMIIIYYLVHTLIKYINTIQLLKLYLFFEA